MHQHNAHRLLAQRESANTVEVAESLGIETAVANNALNQLLRRGLVERVGPRGRKGSPSVYRCLVAPQAFDAGLSGALLDILGRRLRARWAHLADGPAVRLDQGALDGPDRRASSITRPRAAAATRALAGELERRARLLREWVGWCERVGQRPRPGLGATLYRALGRRWRGRWATVAGVPVVLMGQGVIDRPDRPQRSVTRGLAMEATRRVAGEMERRAVALREWAARCDRAAGEKAPGVVE